MTCFICKGHMEHKLTNFTVDLGHCIVIVKNVPSEVCTQCGEISYSHDVAKRLEKIVAAMEKSLTEIAVINFDTVAA